MAGAKEIRTKIQSIDKTKKMTSAMEMVAASKMRKAQDQMMRSRPYAEKILQVIDHLSAANTEYRHPFLAQRELKRVGYVVISSDRGLCGGLNNNLFKQLSKALGSWKAKGVDAALAVLGSKADAFFKRFGGEVVASQTHLGDSPSMEDLLGVVRVMLEDFSAGRLDALFVAYNRFDNRMQQTPVLTQVLPMQPSEDTRVQSSQSHWDYLYEPDAQALLDEVLKRYVESQIYQAVVENLASEQASRMVAMKNATDNAGELIDELQLIYNKARQAAITQELAEIVAGAEAV